MRFVLANCVYFCFLFYCSIVDLQCCINHFCSAKWFSYTYMWWFSSLSRVWLFATPRTVASQAAQSMGFSRQEYWNGLPFPSQGIFLTQESNPGLLNRRQILYQLSSRGSPYTYILHSSYNVFFYIMIYHRILNVALCVYSRTLLLIHSVYNGLHLLTPTSPSSPPPLPFPLATTVCSLCLILFVS